MGENEEKEEDVKGHSHWGEPNKVHDEHVGLNKDDEDDVEGHRYTDPDSSHFTEPDQVHKD